MTGPATDRETTLTARRAASASGVLLRLIDRACALGYGAFTLFIAAEIIATALERSLWLLWLLVPVLVSLLLVVPSLYRSCERGFRLTWPVPPARAKGRWTLRSRP